MMKSINLIFAIGAAIVFASSSGCVAIFNHVDFVGYKNTTITNDLTCGVSLRPKLTDKHIPLIFNYRTCTGPCDLSLDFRSDTTSPKVVEIDEIQFVYPNGRTDRMTNKESRSLKPVLLENGEERSDSQLVWNFDNIVSRYEAVKVRIHGHLTTADGESTEFSIDGDFKTDKAFLIGPYILCWLGP